MKVLVIEDDQKTVEVIKIVFQIGWPEAKVVSTPSGEKGIEMVESESPDIAILDLGLPDISGFEVLKQIRLFSAVPIIILSVRGEENEVVQGLTWGASDYVLKPFRQLELLARVRTQLRKQKPPEEDLSITFGPLRFGSSLHELHYDEREISLTSTEGRILYLLMKNQCKVVTYSSLAEEVWGEDYPGAADSIKVYIRRLRGKIEQDPGRPQLILNKAGVGYLLAKPG
jgi:two-component system KDP operon response regulator KdpE